MAELGHPLADVLLDRDELEQDPGARVRVRVTVPRSWILERASIEVTLPERVACARCDGGGCDGCGRSGAFRLAPAPASRSFTLGLPGELAGDGLVLRVPRPFGAASPVAQVLCEVREGDAAANCTRLPSAGARAPGHLAPSPRVALAGLALVVVAVLGWLAFGR